ncbi:MAG: class I SAM-dependent methyltransferase [Candidatus Muiribacteriaceae bacterium]
MKLIKEEAEMKFMASKLYFKPLWESMVKDHNKDFNIGRKDTALDIGSGFGVLTDLVAKEFKVKDMYGITIDPERCRIASENYSDYKFFLMVVQDMEFEDNKFDLVFSRGSYRFWNDKIQGFREILRVMKPGAFALIGGGFGKSNDKANVKQARKNLGRMTNTSGDDSKLPYPTRDELAQMLRQAGIQEFEFTSPEYPGMWISFYK